MKRIFLISIISGLTACAHHSSYVKQGATTADWQREYNDCLVKANLAGYSGGDIGANIARNRFIDMCLQGQGWALRSNESIRAEAQAQNSRIDDFKVKYEELTSKIKEVCNKKEYAKVIAKSPCMATEINLDHMTDSSKLSASLKKPFLNYRKEAGEFLKQQVELLRDHAVNDRDRKIADAWEATMTKSEQNNLDLYGGKITWGEYNKNRKDNFTSLQSQQRGLASGK